MALLLIISLAWAALVAWLIARAVAQYGAYEQLKAPIHSPPSLPGVDVIVPARDEEANIERCVRGLLEQDYPADLLQVIVVDDSSTDRTPQIVHQIAQADPRVKLLTASALPAGWKGKPHACWQGAAAARGSPWLCFIDADAAGAPPLLRSAIAAAESRGIDMLSLEPFQRLGSFWERVLIPAGFFLLAFSQDLGRVNDPATPDAVANGQFILIRRDVYRAVEGHSGVRSEFSEDSALARRVKSSGHRLAVIGAESLISTRMYTSLATLWRGISRSLVDMAGGPGRTLGFAVAAIVLAAATVLLPLWAWQAMTGTAASWTAIAAASAASLAMLGVHVGGAVYFRIPFWYGLLFPLGYLVGAALAVNSVRVRATGRVAWKGRAYAQAHGPEVAPVAPSAPSSASHPR